MAADRLSPAEFCQLERQLVERMAMRKKRNVQMAPMQQLKIALCQHVETTKPDRAHFTAALAEAVFAVSPDQGTGPAQAVASDLQMDWDLACTSAGFVTWLRDAATSTDLSRSAATSEAQPPPPGPRTTEGQPPAPPAAADRTHNLTF